MNHGDRSSWHARLLGVAVTLCLLMVSPARAETPWSEKDTRLASEYLNLLVEKPEYGRVLDLLWDLYDKHNATPFLLESIDKQVKQQPHPSVLLVHAHLLRKAGQLKESVDRYAEVLKADAKNTTALRALADISVEKGERPAALGYLQKLSETLSEGDTSAAPLLVEMGRLQLESSKPEEAARLWEKAVKLKPGDLALTREVAQLMLGAGMLDRALVFYRQLAKTGEPTKKLDALFDLARMEEQADHFPQAVAALREGLSILHFKDWRYQQFFLRLVKAHERFGQLDVLKAELLKAASTKPATERALADIARYSELTVESDDRIKWLRELVQLFPESTDYRWQLVSLLIDHDGFQEAAKLLDEQLKNDGTDMTAMVLLRCLAHLRAGEQDGASRRLQKLYEAQGANADVEKQVLAFAREKSLDDVVEIVLKARIARDPEKPEPVFDLASFYKGRNNLKAMKATLDSFSAGLAGRGQQERMNQIATFLAGTNDMEAAEAAARKAAALPSAGSEEMLHLADVLVQNGQAEESQTLLERAWMLSDTAEKRTDVDERIFSLLAGDEAPRPTVSIENNTEFKMPAMFTGQGFGSDAPVEEKKNAMPQAVLDYASAEALSALLGESRNKGAQAPAWALITPLWVGAASDPFLWRMVRIAPVPTPAMLQRAAWWCFRTNQIDLAYILMSRIIFDSKGQRINAPLDAEKLLLDIAMADRNRMLIQRQLNLITKLDPANKAAYRRRLCEQYLEMAADPAPRDEHERVVSAWLRSQATKILEELVKEDPQNEAVISALAQCYAVDGRKDKALTLWQKAAQSAKGNATPMLERYADALITQRKFKDYLDTQAHILESETDVKRRREIFQRMLERLLFIDSFNGELPEDEKKKRLDLVSTALTDQARRHPFDGFWHEALAGVFEKAGDPGKAFAEMKQAYYTSPDTPFSLDQLRAAAMKVGDLKSAIYFQKQVAASAEAKDEAGEWRELVQLLEDDFRMNEADQARRRLEARISQDPTALEELAKYYNESGQDDAARRVQEQITRVKGWDGKALLRLALTQRQSGNPAEAAKTLRQLLTSVKGPAQPDTAQAERLMQVERWPWPLLDERKATNAAPSTILNAVENAPGLEPRDRERIRVFLSLPRAELTEVPEEPLAVRLRAIEELAKLDVASVAALKSTFSEREQVWASFYSGDGKEFRRLASSRLTKVDRIEAQFLYIWLGLRSHGAEEVTAWVRQNGLDDAARKARKTLLQAVVSVLAEDGGFNFTLADVEQLGGTASLSFPEIREFTRKLVGRRQYDLAIALGEAARQHAPSFRTATAMVLAEIAGMAGRVEDEHRYLQEVWSQPLGATRDISSDDISGIEADRYISLAYSQMMRAPIPSGTDPFSQSFIRLWRQATTSAEREKLLRESWSRIHRLPATAQNTLRSARILGVTGATDRSGEMLAQYFSGPFLTARPFAEPVYKNMPKGVDLGPRIDELNHLRDYWRDGIEWGLTLQEEGLGDAVLKVDEAISIRNGGVPLGAKSNYEFGTWKNQALARKLRGLGYSERIRLVRAQLQMDESVETMRDLGGFLEGQGFTRESIEVYRRLPGRAPSNSEYCESFIRVCEGSWDFLPALPYLERLFDPATDPVFKPLTLNFEVLRERHAHFLAQMHDEPRLRAMAFRLEMPKLVQGRIPETVPYLKELALLLERHGDKAGALAAWEQLHTLWQTDHDATYRRALILNEQGNKTRALEALRDIPLNTAWSEATQRALPLRANLVADAGLWEEMRELMNAATGSVTKAGGPSPLQVRGTIALKEVLVKHQRKVEAMSLLIRAERAAKEEVDRNRLRLEQLKLSSLEPAWTPMQAEARIGALLRMEAFDSEIMKALVEWMKTESAGPRAKSWVGILRNHAATESMGALALSVFAPLLEETEALALGKPWQKTKDPQRAAQLLTVETLLEKARPALAYQVALAGNHPQVTDSPAMVKVLAALKDRHRMDELFSRKIRQNFPGGSDVVGLAEAFTAAGRIDLADELYVRRMEHLRSTNGAYPQLIESYAHFLIGQRRFEKAETLLMAENGGMTTGLPQLLVDLYRGWGRLDRISQELAKFQLPIGVEAEAKFLASQSAIP